jgi:carbon storage regulator
MLVLSRKPGERILIGDDVAVTIVRIGPNTVRLGIDAPREMNIVREELCHRAEANGHAVEQPAAATLER